MTTNVLNTKIGEAENKIPDHDRYVTTPEFNKLTAESFAARLKQAAVVDKTDFDNKLSRRIYFKSNDGSQNICLSTST